MALLLRKKHHSLSLLKPIFTSQRFIQTLLTKGSDSEVESIDPVAPQSYVLDMEKWRKLDTTRLGVNWWIPPFPYYVLKKLKNKGYEAYLVGGCVRDLLLNRVPKDFDIITSATLKQIKRQFHPAFIVGQRFPICIVRSCNLQVEVSSFDTISLHAEEKDQNLLSCMPDDCDEKDFMRWRNSMHRDFTINSLFFDPFKQCVYDYANGTTDLKSLKLRTLVPAHLSFQEDCARILRGIRIAGRLGLSISRDTATAMRELSSSLRELDRGRIMLELNCMLSYGAAGSTIYLLRRFKLFELFFPFQAAYIINQQSHERSTSMMLMKLFFFLDKSVTCDRPCHCILWIGLLAFHHALVINPQDCRTIKTFASALCHGNWNEGVKFASQNQVQVDFGPEISGFSNSKLNQDLAKKVSQLACFVQNSVKSFVDEGSLLKSMSKYPSSLCSGLVFVSQGTASHVAQLFDVLVNDIKSYKDERERSEIDYALLRRGDLCETRFVLGKIILGTLGVELVQKNVVKLEDVEKTCDSMVKHHLLAKNDVDSILFSEPKKEMVKKQELVKVNHLSEQYMKIKELALKDMCKEAVKENLELMGSSHLPEEKLSLLHKSVVKNRKRKMSDHLRDAVKDNSAKPKGTRTSIAEKTYDVGKHHSVAKKDEKRILSLKSKIKFVENNHPSQQEMDVEKDKFASRNSCKEAFEKNPNTDSSHLPAEDLLDKILEKIQQRKISDGLQLPNEDKAGNLNEISTNGKGSRSSLSSLFR